MGEEQGWRAVVADRDAPLARVLRAVGEGERELADAPELAIGISANVVVDLLGVFLRREALLLGHRARIVMGEYDDPIGDMARFADAGVEHAVLIPFFDNLLPVFEASLPTLPPDLLAAKEAELADRYALAFAGAASLRSLTVARPYRYGRIAAGLADDPVAAALVRFDAMLISAAADRGNVGIIDLAAEVAELGRGAAYDPRFYLRAKAPFSAALLAVLAAQVAQATRGFHTRFMKALVLDCDNTLWGGVIGEDLLGGIKLDPFDAPGKAFWAAQQVIAGLERRGVILCLNTKNNPDDVAEVFAQHPHMVLKDTMIAARRVNWQDKVSNLVELAEELNIGLDAMVFLDDSAVELESVRARLPMVRTVAVPADASRYPAVMAEVADLFAGVTAGDGSKTEQYRQRAAAESARAAAGSHEEYLASLGLEVAIAIDSPADAPRIAELSQKSNQFNLTTTRYTEPEIRALMDADDAAVASVTVGNRFGSAGLTGIAVLRFAGKEAVIENFLMSCRVLGQGIEFALWATLADLMRARGATTLRGRFVATPKNAQVGDYYDRLGLTREDDGETARGYSVALADFAPTEPDWIRISRD